MKKLLFTALLLPTLAFAEAGTRVTSKDSSLWQ